MVSSKSLQTGRNAWTTASHSKDTILIKNIKIIRLNALFGSPKAVAISSPLTLTSTLFKFATYPFYHNKRITNSHCATTGRDKYNPSVMDDLGTSLGHRMISWMLLVVEIIILDVKILVEVIRSFIRLFVPPEEVSVVGERVLITGTGHGIGKELAKQYGELGAEVICVDVNGVTNQQTVSELRKLGVKAVGFECDVSKRENVLELKKKVKDAVGDVTILVNNAGIMPTKKWKDHTPEDIIRIFEINVFAHYWLFEAFLPGMIEKDHGHVVGLSSVAGKIGFPHVTAYCGSKFAVRGTMEALAEEFRSQGKNIKFTTICPHMTNTGLCKNVKIRFPTFFSMLEPNDVASQIISAQRRGYREATIPGFMQPLHDFGRLFPEKAQMHLIDFVDSGLVVD